jgi:hypothetical protein
LETPHVGGGKQDPFIAKPNCASHMRCGRGIAAPGLWSGSGRFHAHGCKLRRALPGPWRPRVDRNLPQPDGILNLIGGSSSLEQSAPSPLQVAVSFNRILKGAGHECLLVSAAVTARWPSGIQFPISLPGDAVPTGMGGRGASPVAVGGSGRSRSGIRLRAENTSLSWSAGVGWGVELEGCGSMVTGTSGEPGCRLVPIAGRGCTGCD